mmetsp:Transcript_22850/g.70927  ORF Transcript_22850/g.70927 Transcript_22850/m.70927 type:complete len:125 (+) Transcript_22850:270-644(+)
MDLQLLAPERLEFTEEHMAKLNVPLEVADLAGPSRSNLARMVTMNRAILGYLRCRQHERNATLRVFVMAKGGRAEVTDAHLRDSGEAAIARLVGTMVERLSMHTIAIVIEHWLGGHTIMPKGPS